MKSNYPTARLSQEIEDSPDFVSDTIQSLSEIAKLGKPQTTEELESRIDLYFRFCGEHGCRCGIESLALCLSVDRTTFWRWCGSDCGKGEKWMELCRQARQFIISFTEQAMISGRLSPPVAIFSMKNLANWKDAISFEDATPAHTTNNNILAVTELPKLTAEDGE